MRQWTSVYSVTSMEAFASLRGPVWKQTRTDISGFENRSPRKTRALISACADQTREIDFLVCCVL